MGAALHTLEATVPAVLIVEGKPDLVEHLLLGESEFGAGKSHHLVYEVEVRERDTRRVHVRVLEDPVNAAQAELLVGLDSVSVRKGTSPVVEVFLPIRLIAKAPKGIFPRGAARR